MQVTETLSEGLKRAYTVVVPASDIESKRAARFANLGKTLALPGFRPGKVPLTLVRQRYGTAVTAEVLEELVSEATRQVLSERGLRPAQQPKVDLISLDAAAGSAKDLEFKVELELLPEITLPDFSTDQPNAHEGRGVAGDGGQGVGGHRPAQPGAGGDNCRRTGRSRCGGG